MKKNLLIILVFSSLLLADETEDFLSSLPNHTSTKTATKVDINESKITKKEKKEVLVKEIKPKVETKIEKKILPSNTIDSVLVVKSESRIYLLSNGKSIKDYRISLGKSPIGHKLKEGDQKTPEGNYTLDYKKKNSTFHRAIHISYPNQKDRANAKKSGVSAGGLIMVHGQTAGELDWFSVWAIRFFDWTDGCIAVTNEEIDEIYSLVKIGTPIEIRP